MNSVSLLFLTCKKYDLCAAEELQGEAGYYLTTLESALMWIVSESQKSEVKK